MLDWYAVDYNERKKEGFKALEALIKEWNDSEKYATLGEIQQACFHLMGSLNKIPSFFISFQFEYFRIFATVSTYDWHGTGKEVLEGTVVIDVYHDDNYGYWLELDWKSNDQR